MRRLASGTLRLPDSASLISGGFDANDWLNVVDAAVGVNEAFTGESMLDIAATANEPVLSVLMCTSPMPMTGFTVTLPKSECVDLNITIDQAFQYIVSCGVVVPPQQLQSWEGGQLALPPADQADQAEAIEVGTTATKSNSGNGRTEAAKPSKKVG